MLEFGYGKASYSLLSGTTIAGSKRSACLLWSENKPSSAGFCSAFDFRGCSARRLASSASEIRSAPGMTCCSPAPVRSGCPAGVLLELGCGLLACGAMFGSVL